MNKAESTLPSSIAPSIEELIALFSQHLPDVEFPSVNASSLAELGCKVSASHTAVVELERQLQSAHEVYSSAKRALLESSKTALGYAKVYAADDEELLSALSAIHIGKKARVDPAKRKSRRTKKTEQASLPLAHGCS